MEYLTISLSKSWAWYCTFLGIALIIDVGKVLAAIQAPPSDKVALEEFLKGLGYTWWDETDNRVYKRFMTKDMGKR